MTVGELRKRIKNLPADTPIYIVIDKLSEDAWDEDKGQRRYEIAKDIFARCLSSEDVDMRAFCARELDMSANDCVREANALIKALKEQPKP